MSFSLKYAFVVLSVAVAVAIPMFSFRFNPSRPLRMASPDESDDQVINPVQDFEIFKDVFHFPDVFLYNYARMEEHFKIFVYPNKVKELCFYYNERKIHGMVSSELFFHYSLLVSDRFVTRNESEANMFFIPLSWCQIPGKGDYANGENCVQYLIKEYPYWNRTNGTDHFFVTCHDNGARLSQRFPLNTSITVLCSASAADRGLHYKFHHVTLPQIRLPFVSPVGGNDSHLRTRLAFWASRESAGAGNNIKAGSRRCVKPLTNNLSDQEKFKTSRYCICDGSSHLTRICITDSIHYGCVPVFLYEDDKLPFIDILDWEKFSVTIRGDHHRVLQILEAISDSKFSKLHNNLRKVQRHFQWNSPSEKYDLFHMIMYELWLRHISNYLTNYSALIIQHGYVLFTGKTWMQPAWM